MANDRVVFENDNSFCVVYSVTLQIPVKALCRSPRYKRVCNDEENRRLKSSNNSFSMKVSLRSLAPFRLQLGSIDILCMITAIHDV